MEYDKATIKPINTAIGKANKSIITDIDDVRDPNMQAMSNTIGTWPNKIQPVITSGFLFFFFPTLTKIMPATIR